MFVFLWDRVAQQWKVELDQLDLTGPWMETAGLSWQPCWLWPLFIMWNTILFDESKWKHVASCVALFKKHIDMFLFLPEVVKIKKGLLKGINEEFTSYIQAAMLQICILSRFWTVNTTHNLHVTKLWPCCFNLLFFHHHGWRFPASGVVSYKS